MSNHVQHVIKIFQALETYLVGSARLILPLLISYSVKGHGRAWLEATVYQLEDKILLGTYMASIELPKGVGTF